MRVQFASQSVLPVRSGEPSAIRFQGKSNPSEANVDMMKRLAEGGNAQMQFDYAQYLYDNKVSRWLKFKANVLLPATMNFLALIPPLRVVHNVSEDTLECYKWFYLAQRKKNDIEVNRIESWLRPLNLVMRKQDIDEAKRRAHVWLAEFEPEHRGTIRKAI